MYTVGGALIREGLWETHTCRFPLSREMISYITLTAKTNKCIYSIWQLSAAAAAAAERHLCFFEIRLHYTLQLNLYNSNVAVRREGYVLCACVFLYLFHVCLKVTLTFITLCVINVHECSTQVKKKIWEIREIIMGAASLR